MIEGKKSFFLHLLGREEFYTSKIWRGIKKILENINPTILFRKNTV